MNRRYSVRRRAGRLAAWALGACAGLAALCGLALVGWVAAQGLPALSWEFLTAPPRQLMRAGGIGPATGGTLLLVAGAVLVSVPLGVGTAIYLNEYAPPGPLPRAVRLAVRSLAGLPPVVFGLFGLTAFVFGLGLGPSVAAGSLTLGLLVLPTVAAAAEAALRAVPRGYREAALALGATRWQMVRRAVLPAALPGIATGVALAVARAAGEAAPILFTAAAFRRPDVPLSLTSRVMALPYYIYVTAMHIPDLPPARIYGAALVLLALTVGVSLVALALRRPPGTGA